MILAILGLIPGVMSLVQFIVGKRFDSQVSMYTARWGVTRDVAVAAIQAEATTNQAKASWIAAVASSPVLSFVVLGFSFPFIFYWNKTIVYDICLGLGSTPPLKYELLTQWGGVIIGGIFLTASGVGVTHAIINRRD